VGTPLEAIRLDAQGVDFQLGGFLGSLFSRRVPFEEFGSASAATHIVNIIRTAYLQHMRAKRSSARRARPRTS
jgi:hypothetical protein